MLHVAVTPKPLLCFIDAIVLNFALCAGEAPPCAMIISMWLVRGQAHLLSLTLSLTDRLLVYDGEECTFRVMKLRGKRDDCAVCGRTPAIATLDDT